MIEEEANQGDCDSSYSGAPLTSEFQPNKSSELKLSDSDEGTEKLSREAPLVEPNAIA